MTYSRNNRRNNKYFDMFVGYTSLRSRNFVLKIRLTKGKVKSLHLGDVVVVVVVLDLLDLKY